MSTTTPNLGLTVPAMGDQISSTIPALGTNFQTIDNQVGTNTNQIGILSENAVYAAMPPYNVSANGQDQSANIQAAINYASANNIGKVILPPGILNIASSISIPSYITIEGAGINITRVTTTINTIHAFTTSNNARKVTIRKLTIDSSAGIGASNAAIKNDDALGGAEHLYNDLEINNFYYGCKSHDFWWNSTIENVRLNNCGYSIMSDGTQGQCINNNLIRVYSNAPTIMGYQLSAIKCWTLLDCNFGGHATNNNQYIQVLNNSFNLKMIGCNFEAAIIPAGAGGVEVWSSSTVSISNCTFVSNHGAAATAYEISVRDSAKVVLDGFYQQNQGASIKQLALQNSAQVVMLDDSLTDVNHLGGSAATTKVSSNSKPRRVRAMSEIVLNGAAQSVLIMVPTGTGRITGVKLVYTEASSADAGVTVTVKNTYDTIYTGTSEASKAQFYVNNVTLNRTTLYNNDPLLVTTPGGKVGTGKIMVEVDYVLD